MDLKSLAVLFFVLLYVVPVSAAGNSSLNVQDVGANVTRLALI
jgi:hypothetical protein